jgi:predicted dehydrogenase
MPKVGVGIIGCGGIARGAHIPNYKKLPNVKIVACSDVVPSAAKACAKEFKIPKTYADYEDMLELKEIDAVSVCTPNFIHMAPTIAALKAGKHVLCEKPLAVNVREGKAMVDAARRSGRKLVVGLQNRLSSGAQCLKKFSTEGCFGEIYFARAHALRRRQIPSWGVFIQKEKQGGGPLIDIGVHVLDLTLYVMGFPRPASAFGATYVKFGNRSDIMNLWGKWDPEKYTVEDFGVGLLRFRGGETISLEASFASNIEREVFNTTLLGTEGGCQLDPLRIYREEKNILTDTTPVFLPEVNCHEQEMRLFIESVVNDTEPFSTGEQALLTTKCLDAIYRSAETGREAAVED